MQKRIRYNLLCWLLSLFASVSNANELKLTGREASVPLIPTIEAFEDKSALMGISEISQHGNFTSQQKLLRPGFTSSAIWLKLTLTNTASAQITRWISIQPTRLEKVDFFTRKDNQWQHLSAGNHQPFSTWPISAVNSVFPIQLAPLDTQSVYIRVSSNTRISQSYGIPPHSKR